MTKVLEKDKKAAFRGSTVQSSTRVDSSSNPSWSSLPEDENQGGYIFRTPAFDNNDKTRRLELVLQVVALSRAARCRSGPNCALDGPPPPIALEDPSLKPQPFPPQPPLPLPPTPLAPFGRGEFSPSGTWGQTHIWGRSNLDGAKSLVKHCFPFQGFLGQRTVPHGQICGCFFHQSTRNQEYC